MPVLQPILKVFESYLGTPSTPTVAGQHVLDADYFRRIEALNFTMVHDDGQLPQDLNDADIVLVGISRTSKTPTSIYLANRGFKTANMPLVPGVELPPQLDNAAQGLRGRPGGERRAHRPGPPQPRASSMPDHHLDDYVDREAIADEIAQTRGAVRAARLADHRRDAPLDRGDGGGHHPPAITTAKRRRSRHEQLPASRTPAADPRLGEPVARRMLEAAGLAFIVVPPGLDEARDAPGGQRQGSLSPQMSPRSWREPRPKPSAISRPAW